MKDNTLFRPALLALGILHSVMFAALFADVDPHPPLATPLFGMGPFLGAVLAVLAAAWVSGRRGLGALGAALALLSFGPQKYLDAQLPLIWPAVVLAQIAVVVLVLEAVRTRRAVAV